MITINLYNYSGENNVVNKNLPTPVTITGLFYNEVNVIRPVVKIKRTPAKFNYVYIPTLNRYYFVNSMHIINNNYIMLNLSVDVLQSFKNSILASTATSIFNKNDNKLNINQPIYELPLNTSKYEYNDVLDHTGSIIMVTIKGN